ncbi:hypothetical protein NCCP133_26050 [Cytobacillus sp. NCCP-133]|nr:hypothetical protein NCCP133_26050 [Cytobacillus sp. NCCP-133]
MYFTGIWLSGFTRRTKDHSERKTDLLQQNPDRSVQGKKIYMPIFLKKSV